MPGLPAGRPVNRAVLFVLLGVVAAAAAVLSFAALRDLALVCGFTAGLAWLLPVTVDAGAAAGTLAWLGAGGRARSFGRALALTLLGSSVAGNALGHALAAYSTRPPWAVVVAVSATAPAVLGAVVHLAVLAGRRPHRDQVGEPSTFRQLGGRTTVPTCSSSSPHTEELLDGDGLSRFWDDAPPAGSTVDVADPRAAGLIAAGVGRRKLARELGVSEHEARALLAAHRNGGPR
ncbi:MAG TPA: DUF2637 domain-containing protein [Pseudonocardia sp.]|nr:DUF2637 domain-containing protein [Pseudonocardia sp.]